MKYRKMDAHAHVDFDPGDLEKQIDFADRLGIEKLCLSRPVTNFSGNDPEDPKEVKRSNNLVIKAMKQFPDRVIGFLTLNPVYQIHEFVTYLADLNVKLLIIFIMEKEK